MDNILDFCLKNNVDVEVQCPDYVFNGITLTMRKGWKLVRNKIGAYELDQATDKDEILKWFLEKMLKELNEETDRERPKSYCKNESEVCRNELRTCPCSESYYIWEEQE